MFQKIQIFIILLGILIPFCGVSQQKIPEGTFKKENAKWMIVLGVSKSPFATNDLKTWKKNDLIKVKFYQNDRKIYRALIDVPLPLKKSIEFQDSLLDLGLEAKLVMVYANRFYYQNWGELIDIGYKIQSCSEK